MDVVLEIKIDLQMVLLYNQKKNLRMDGFINQDSSSNEVSLETKKIAWNGCCFIYQKIYSNRVTL